MTVVRPRRISFRSLLAFSGALVLAAAMVTVPADFAAFVVMRALAFSVAALGPLLVLGLGGRTSLAHGALMALGAYSYGACVRGGVEPGWGLIVAAAAGGGAAGLLGAACGHLTGPSFAVATLGFQVAVDQLAVRAPTLTGGHMGLSVPTPSGPGFVVFALAATLAIFVGTHRIAGEGLCSWRWRAIRDRPMVASVTGLSPRAHVAGLLALSGALSGWGGALAVPLSGLVHPAQYGLLESIELLIVATLAAPSVGRGIVVGALTISALTLLGGLAEYRTLLWAGVILVAVRASPREPR